MAEYSYESIIINPFKEGIENLIGKEVYFHNVPCCCLDAANENATTNLGILEKICTGCVNPFFIIKEFRFLACTCIIEKKEEPKPKSRYVPFKNKMEFLDAHRSCSGCLNEEAYYLSKNGIWLKGKFSKAYYMVTKICNRGVFIVEDSDETSWEKILENYTFLDGSPCGKEVK